MLEDEALLIIERQNAQLATETSLLQLAVGSILDKKSGKLLKDRLKKLAIEVVPRSMNDGPEAVEWRPSEDQLDKTNGWVPPEVEE